MTKTSPASSSAGTIEIVPMTAEHLPQALSLSQDVQWPYRIEDWEVAFGLGHGFAAEKDGELVGTALWWPYAPDFATAGMIIVSEKVQRRGIGARLMEALLSDAGERRVVLNSTAEGQKLYLGTGFEPYSIVLQHQAVLSRAPEVDPSVPLRKAEPKDDDAILAIDRAGAGMGREALINAMREGAETLVVDRGEGATGYGVVRRWGRGVVVGPVVAEDADDARALIAALAGRHVGTFVRIDVTESCGLAPWLETLGLPRAGRVVTMALGKPPEPASSATLFALANQSLG